MLKPGAPKIKENKRKINKKSNQEVYKFLGRPIVQWWTMNYSTTTCTLIDIILALHWSVCRIPMINSVPKPCRVSFHRRCNIIKAINRHACIALGQLIMTSLTKQITAPQILSITKLENFGITAMCFTISDLLISTVKAIVIRKRP